MNIEKGFHSQKSTDMQQLMLGQVSSLSTGPGTEPRTYSMQFCCSAMELP